METITIPNFMMSRSLSDNNIIFGWRGERDFSIKPIYELPVKDHAIAKRIYDSIIELLRWTNRTYAYHDPDLDKIIQVSGTQLNGVNIELRQCLSTTMDPNTTRDLAVDFTIIVSYAHDGGAEQLFNAHVTGVAPLSSNVSKVCSLMRKQWASLED